MEMWRRNRNITKCAACNACSAKMPDRRSNAPKQTWKQSLYKCSVCNSALPASKFDTTKLKQWEDSSTLYLARCGSCDSDMKTNAQTMTCNLCFETKPSHAFSPARQRARDYTTRRCKDCDFPPVLLVRHHSDADEADTIYVSCLSIPSLCVRSPETSVYPESRDGEADLAMRSLPTVDVEETRRCSRQRRSDSSDYQTTDAQLVSDMLI